METIDNNQKQSEDAEKGGSFAFKRVPHVMILPDGSKPDKLGSGTITSLLGVGGMSNVYEIWNSHLEMKRAVKLLHPNYSQDSKERFETEIKITAKLDHPNIVEIHAVGEWNGLPYIEMEKIEGVTLEKLVSDRGGLPFEVCTSIGIMMSRALRYAHSHQYALYGESYHGIIHRDLKPNNIMVTNEGNVKLMDFGIARPIDASIHTTDSSAVMGTMQYLSPELLEGKTPDIRTDIYSLGAILYEMVTGMKAFTESNISKLMLSKIRNEFKPLDSFKLKIPPRLKRLIRKCLSREREKRPQDAAAMLTELMKIHKMLTPQTPEAVMQAFMGTDSAAKTVVGIRRRIPGRAIAACLAAAIFAAGTVFMFRFIAERRDAAPPPVVVKTEQPHVPAPAPLEIKKPAPGRTREMAVLSAKSASKPAISEKAAAPQKTDVTFIDELKNQFGTPDILDLFVKEIKLGRYEEASKVFRYIPPEVQQSKTALLYRMRMFEGLGDKTNLEQILLTQAVDDGEFYLAKARYYYGAGNSEKCLAYLDACSKSRCEILDPVTLRQDILYYKALCYSKEFDSHPSRATMKNALDSWFEVKLLFRSMPEHKYYKSAETEMQRIGDSAKEIKG
jgi:hypothetical protein